jgi:hypothetical protein
LALICWEFISGVDMKDFEKGAIYILIQNGNLFVRRRRYGKR